MTKFWLLLPLFAFVLGGCTTPQSRTQLGKAALGEAQQWQAKGKVGLKLRGEARSASFDWQQNKNDYTVRFHGVLGFGSTLLKKSGKTVSLSAKDKIVKARSAEALLNQQLGWSVPVSELIYWIKGAPSPKSKPQVTFNEDGTLASIEQSGWTIRYHRYQAFANQKAPRKIVATREGITLTVIVKQWRIL